LFLKKKKKGKLERKKEKRKKEKRKKEKRKKEKRKKEKRKKEKRKKEKSWSSPVGRRLIGKEGTGIDRTFLSFSMTYEKIYRHQDERSSQRLVYKLMLQDLGLSTWEFLLATT
jgi:signal recognition particle GTPase